MQGIQLPEPPYPADTRAKGWRFEIDHERIRQSDTWALATPEVRPWLLMLWMVAWEQMPCGSLPNDDALIAARVGMAPKAFARHRDLLMRGWTPSSDGRLYHHVITLRVLEMLEYRRKEAERRSKNRGKPAEVPGVSRGTGAGQQQDDTRSPGTRTSTSTNTSQGDKPLVKAAGRGAKKCPPSFEVTDELKAWAAAEVPGVDIDRQTAKFKDHTFKNAHTDWAGTWRNWMRTVAERMATASPPVGRHAGFASKNYREGITEDGSLA